MVNELIFVGVIISFIIIIAIVILKYRKQLISLTNSYELKLEDALLVSKKSKQLGENVMKGEFVQILGTFSLLTEYEHLSLITSVSKQASFDLIGLKEDSLDFIEIKSPGARLSGKEGRVKKLIEENKVGYRIIELSIPKGFVINERE